MQPLISFLVGTLFLAISLRLACWALNRLLPPDAPQGPPGAILAELGGEPEPQTYRTVEAGPFTAPATAQRELDVPVPGEGTPAVPIPSLLGALGIAAAQIVATLAMLLVVDQVMGRIPPPQFEIWMLAKLGANCVLAFMSAVLLNQYFLPVTFVRSLLVSLVEFVSLIGLVLLLTVAFSFAIDLLRMSGWMP